MCGPFSAMQHPWVPYTADSSLVGIRLFSFYRILLFSLGFLSRKRDEWDDECNTNEQNTNTQSNSSLDKVQEWYNQVVKLWPASSPVQYHSMDEDTGTTPVMI